MYGGALLARTYNMIKISASEARWASYALQSTLMSNASNSLEANLLLAIFSTFDLIE
jgi:predicted proteasome-type protease